jgi:hypothetical protein
MLVKSQQHRYLQKGAAIHDQTKHKDQFLFNSQVHKNNTQQTSNLYLRTANLAIYQKGVYYSEIKITVIYLQPLKIYLVIKINSY